jgi:NADH-quinone oxidoreductase subunit G
VLAKLANVSGADLASVWKLIAAEVPALGTMSYANLPETGLLLDATPFAALPFVEGETLHFKPAAPVAANA